MKTKTVHSSPVQFKSLQAAVAVVSLSVVSDYQTCFLCL